MLILDVLSRPQSRAVADLARTATDHDGTGPLDEAAHFARGSSAAEPGVEHLLVEDGDLLTGYAGILADGTVQGMVHPDRRGRGIGSALLQTVLERRPDAGVWAHGALEGSLRFLRRAGLEETRRLLTMSRRLGAGAPPVPQRRPRCGNVRLDTFSPRRDAEQWVAVNAAAFADHPEQGRLGIEDLRRRMAEPWFRPEDLHVARDGQRMLAFVWVKREQDEDAEIYAVGTDPEFGGQGLAGALLSSALHALETQGVPAVHLYVEADSPAAVHLYEALGFTVSGQDVQMRRPASAPPPTGTGAG